MQSAWVHSQMHFVNCRICQSGKRNNNNNKKQFQFRCWQARHNSRTWEHMYVSANVQILGRCFRPRSANLHEQRKQGKEQETFWGKPCHVWFCLFGFTQEREKTLNLSLKSCVLSLWKMHLKLSNKSHWSCTFQLLVFPFQAEFARRNPCSQNKRLDPRPRLTPRDNSTGNPKKQQKLTTQVE